jgi:hypothetical protein
MGCEEYICVIEFTSEGAGRAMRVMNHDLRGGRERERGSREKEEGGSEGVCCTCMVHSEIVGR